MKLTLFAALMVAFATETTATSVGHHALDNFDDDAVLFGEIYNFDAPPVKKAVAAKKAGAAVKKAIAGDKKAPAKKADDSGSDDSDSDSGSDGGADSGSGSDSKDDDSGSDSDDDDKSAPAKKGGADSADSGSDSDSDDDEEEKPKKAVAKKMAVVKAIKKKPPTIEGGKGSLPPKKSMPVAVKKRLPAPRKVCREECKLTCDKPKPIAIRREP